MVPASKEGSPDRGEPRPRAGGIPLVGGLLVGFVALGALLSLTARDASPRATVGLALVVILLAIVVGIVLAMRYRGRNLLGLDELSGATAVESVSAPAPATPLPVTPTPVTAPSSSPTPSAPAEEATPSAPPRSPEKEPPWPMVPLTVVQSTDREKFWRMASASGLDRAKILIFTPESSGALTGKYGMSGAQFHRLSRREGDENISPGDVDRMGYLIDEHFGKGSGRAVVIDGVSMLLDANGLKTVRRLLELANEAAETTRGAVLVYVNPDTLPAPDLRKLTEMAAVLRLK